MTTYTPKQIITFGGGAFALLFILILLSSSFYTVKEGQRGIVTQFNKLASVEDPGLHMKIPFIQSVLMAEVRTLQANATASASTIDTQNVSTGVSLNYHLDPSKVGLIYSQTGLDVEKKIIVPRIQEVVKAVIARYSAEQLLSKRDIVKTEINVQLTKMLSTYNIILEDVQITQFNFSEIYYDSIEKKQIAEQAALTAVNNTKRVTEEAKQAVEKAKGEAESIRIQTEAIKQNGGQEFIQLKAIEAWDGKLPTTMTSGAITPFINVSK